MHIYHVHKTLKHPQAIYSNKPCKANSLEAVKQRCKISKGQLSTGLTLNSSFREN